MESIAEIKDKIRDLVTPLNAEERLALIQTIAAMESANEAGDSSSEERRQQLAAEQAAWYARPLEERQSHPGEFIAVYNQQIIDHDPDQRSLYLRVRERFGRSPVLIVHADWEEPPVYTMHSPRLEQQ
jgi:hypothetical protein